MIYLSDLPTGALSHVSSFLAAPSRALFAVALNYCDVERSSAIAGDDWDVLDFGDIEKDLAAKISDDDIRAVLLSIDAVNNLKRLRLTNCINITGVGLDPLRGSTIIQDIDLSLVGVHESCRLDPEPPISCAEVIPILDSIIERGEDCSLEHLQFPNEWRRERNTVSDFHAFLTRYNDYLNSRADVCLKCSCNLPGDGHMLRMDEYQYGTQNFTCHDCMNKFCDECDDDLFGCYISVCDRCERSYCGHCQTVYYCSCCENSYCVDCVDSKQCSQCEEKTCLNCLVTGCHNNCDADIIWCSYCVENENAFSSCKDCNERYCGDCCDSDIHAVKCCVGCKKDLCSQCRVNRCKEGRNCTKCYQLAFHVLLESKERQHQEMQAENDNQRNEINQLKRRVKDLSNEI